MTPLRRTFSSPARNSAPPGRSASLARYPASQDFPLPRGKDSAARVIPGDKTRATKRFWNGASGKKSSAVGRKTPPSVPAPRPAASGTHIFLLADDRAYGDGRAAYDAARRRRGH